MSVRWSPVSAAGRFVRSARDRRQRHGEKSNLSLEELERRCLLATVSWTNLAGGNWNTATNWRDDAGLNRVPGPADDVVIDLAGANYTVTLNVDATVAMAK